MNSGTLVVGGGQRITIPVEGVSYDDCYEKASDQMRGITRQPPVAGFELSSPGDWYLSECDLMLCNRTILRGTMTFTLRPHEDDER